MDEPLIWSWADRIASLRTRADAEGFAWSLELQGIELPRDAVAALARKKIELRERENRK